ncbi:uncharacterized protein LOC132796812 [Drosophila nasuta]|uniref:uncharacterized protein LOC132796812 n=1 Tax=Drosophila nasuta TaxID=42062 RepID=UPI00295E27E5|nr:uncharacterized protein LOC132796812 [Drosophila nasuta]
MKKSNEIINDMSGYSGGYRRRRLHQGICRRPENFEVRRIWRNVNRQFERGMERALGGMEPRDKILATEWINKLMGKPPNLLQYNERNSFIRKPFSNPSILNSLSKLTAIMPMISLKKKSVIELIKNSVDNGEFIYKLPVPRDGAFFILHLSPNL